MDPIVIFRIMVTQHGHRTLADAAHFVDCGIVKPHIACGDTQSRRGSVEDDALEAVDGEARVGPVQVPNQIFGEVAILAAQTREALGIGEITYEYNEEKEERYTDWFLQPWGHVVKNNTSSRIL